MIERYFLREKGKLRTTLEGKNALYGYLFILPFIIGFLSFMLFPMIQSLIFTFSEVKIDMVNNRFNLNYTGIENVRRVLTIDPHFNRLLAEEITRMLLIVPAVVFFSLFAALLLNQSFHGRSIVRVIFFLPVILSSGIMIGIETSNSLLSGMAEAIRNTNQMRSSITGMLERILVFEDAAVNDYLQYLFLVINQIYSIAMASGIQIIIMLSALQTIPSSVYESAKIEGAASWECFWKITFPMIGSLILVNVVYSVVDFFLRTDNLVMDKIRTTLLGSLDYGYSSAMAWVYFLAVMLILGIVVGGLSKKVYYYE